LLEIRFSVQPKNWPLRILSFRQSGNQMVLRNLSPASLLLLIRIVAPSFFASLLETQKPIKRNLLIFCGASPSEWPCRQRCVLPAIVAFAGFVACRSCIRIFVGLRHLSGHYGVFSWFLWGRNFESKCLWVNFCWSRDFYLMFVK
jgi:hypothetical protein